MKKIISFLVCLTAVLVLPATAQVLRVASPGMTVRDMDRSVNFYTQVLGFRKISDTFLKGKEAEQLEGVFGLHARIVQLQLGTDTIELTDYLTSGGRSVPEDARSNDLSFQHIAIVVSDMDKAFAILAKQGVEFVSTAPQTLPATIPAAAGIKAFYFHDPDQHNLELIWFPKDKGLNKWHIPSHGKIFLGIDHTAIGVSNTDRSHEFYTSLLGFDRKGDSWNKGTEQEHLNNVEGASLHITGYRAAAGPGIEFLQYLQPGPGRAYPADTRADDIWFWQTTLVVNEAKALFEKLKAAGAHLISTDLVRQTTNGITTLSFLVRDPDGHALLIRQYIQPNQ